MLADERLQALAAVAAQDRPELQRAEAAAERNGVLAQARDVVAGAEVLRHQAERAPQVVGAATPKDRAVHRREEPLVRVDADRVRPLPAGEQVAQLRADGGRTQRRPRRRGARRPRPRTGARSPGRDRSRPSRSSRSSPRPRTRRRVGARRRACGSPRRPARHGARAPADGQPSPSPSACAPSRRRRVPPAAPPARPQARRRARPRPCPRCGRASRPAARGAPRASRASPPPAPGGRATCARGSRPGSGRL